MLVLVLGKGKTGSLVAEIARERGHGVRALDINDNPHASALTAPNLAGVDVVIDFTAPEAAVENMRAVLSLGGRIVVGTTGWYAHLNEMKALAHKRSGGLLYGTNFSLGVQKLFRLTAELARLDGYRFSIDETHHASKLDAPSGTALTLREIIREARPGADVPIESHRRRQGRAHCARSERPRHAGAAARCALAPRLCAGRGARGRVAGGQKRRVGVPRDFRPALTASNQGYCLLPQRRSTWYRAAIRAE
jgi:4-hydroxy-tetrahydrodipicolinate reductase